ncbi:HAD-IC family P-type ATPase [Nocardioides zhouii]|uniref:Cation-transporting P-type ATPase n=1 Tax=Nocardioides zhouii TaxID=1168729 RepID=A0A4Q2T8P3_9ACTN|nr:HAD-IC family P-type ATPase [Nocardioides zhouii]RYC13378.1 cation-transporting P-type ATPase [Nocardioides zhouii]
MPTTPLSKDVLGADVELLLVDVDVLLQHLDCDASGLSEAEAERRLAVTGPNQLTVEQRSSLPAALLRQLTHPLALLLWLAAALALGTQGVTLGAAIICVIALNAGFALVQERHAEHAVAALALYLPPHATVVRDGRRRLVDAASVVPGDVMLVDEGAAVSADARILEGAVELDMSAVTGESAPVTRQAAPTPPTAADLGRRVVDAEDVLLSGTTCASGEALALVVHTGMSTELGRIAGLSTRTHQDPSPLEEQVRRVAWLIAGVAVAVGVAFLPLGMLAGLSFTEASVFAIGLLVANVPEGLLPTITLALAVGVADLARRGGLVKRLSAVETLGSTDVICTDKTGTLTQNRMQVHSVWSGSARRTIGDPEAVRLARVLRSCSTADREANLGDPTELALLDAADRVCSAALAPRASVEQVFHFDPRRRLMSVVAVPAAGATSGGHEVG